MRQFRISSMIATWIMLLIFTGGCRYFDRLVDNPEPAVDPREAFPTFAGSRGSTTHQSPDGSASARWDFPPCDGWGAASGRLRFAGLFTAELPPGEGWASAETGRATILVRYPPRSSIPSAFLFAERIDPDSPGMALQGFLQRADQRLEASPPLRLPAFLTPSPAPATSENEPSDTAPSEPPDPGVAEPEATTAESGALSPSREAQVDGSATNGEALSVDPDIQSDGTEAPAAPKVSTEMEAAQTTLAVGYASEEGTFTGWRWIGVCTPPEEDLGEKAGETTASEADTVRRPFLRLSRSQGNWRLQAGAQPVPAFLILATVTLPERSSYGAHLVVVCTQTPQCQDAPALARLLGSIRVSSGNFAGGADWGSDALREMLAEVGVAVPAPQPQ